MPKHIIFLLIFSLSVLPGCGDKTSEDSTKTKSDKIVAVSTITIINDIVKNIGKDKVEAYSICGVGIDPHTYHPKPSDPRMVVNSDIVFINGFALEHWIEEMIRGAGGSKTEVVVTEGLTPMTDEKGFGDPDPHAWFDVTNVKKYADNVAKGLIEIDPGNKEYYETNLKEYRLKLDSLDAWIKEQINTIPESQRVLITSHDAFRYFGRAYNIEVKGLQGISTEAKIRTEDLKNLIDYVKQKDLKSVFIETSVNPKLLEQISSETNAKIGGTLYSDSIGNEGTPEGTYIGAVKHNVNTVVNALK
ncbi:MAG: zinc ABC transporter substrate-binding protein [Ignavibacteriae bacterium]|nr:zinc ABC transporter substrate-binding protein [Ignavibacteriota bacterium]